MNRRTTAAITLLTLVLAGCQTGQVRESPSSHATAEIRVEDGQIVEGTHGGGRWVAALESSDDPRAVYVLDRETAEVYQIGSDAQVTIERLEWLGEDELEIYGSGDSLILQILSPEPERPGNPPRFVALPPDHREVHRGEGFPTYGPAPAGDTSNGSLTLRSMHTMKERLKRESFQRRGPRIPKDN